MHKIIKIKVYICGENVRGKSLLVGLNNKTLSNNNLIKHLLIQVLFHFLSITIVFEVPHPVIISTL